MKVVMYGTEICPDCVEAKAILTASAGIELDYRDITKSTKTLKEFLAHRDHDPLFAPVIAVGNIGIPLFIPEDGSETFEIRDFLNVEKPVRAESSCSVDGKGHC